MPHHQQHQQGERREAHGPLVSIPGAVGSSEMDDHEDEPSQERGKRDIAGDDQEDHERRDRGPARERVERQERPQAGRDPFAPAKLQIRGEVVPHDGRQRDQHAELGESTPSQGPDRVREEERREQPLEHVEGEDEQEEVEPQDPADVGRADVPRADRADVDPPDPSRRQVSERDRADQVGDGHRRDVQRQGEGAHWSRPMMSFGFSASPRKAARRASKMSLAVA